MAIFIASTKSISRGSGQSAVASASYRAGVELEDKRYGKTHNYSKKLGVMSADIILPTKLSNANAKIERGELWNMAESAEHRKDARVAREWLINLPHELSKQDRKELAHTFAQTLADRYGTIADCAIHEPTDKEIKRGADPRNFHAHIMLTTRTAEIDDNNKIALTDKATIELSDKKRRSLGMERVSHEITEVRQIWEQIANDKLAEHNLDLLDSRSYADQGKDIEPQLKMGSVATKLERDAYAKAKKDAKEKGEIFQGIEPVTIRGEINSMITERNKLVAAREQRIIFDKREQNESGISDGITWANRKLENISRIVGDAKQRGRETKQAVDDTQRGIEWAAERCEKIPKGIDTINIRIKSTTDGIEWASERCKSIPIIIGDTEQGIEWAAKRCKNLPERGNETQQRIDQAAQRTDLSKRWITHNSERVKASKSLTDGINRDIKRRATPATPAPSPFDTEYDRAFYDRKRRVDREIASAVSTRKDAKLGDEGNNNALAETLREFARRLVTRNREENRLRLGHKDNPNDYPDKFDYRQVKILDGFADKLGIEKYKDFRELQRDAINIFTPDVMENNAKAIDILAHKKRERENYNEVTADFDSFIERLDKSRATKNNELQGRLGRSGISRMTAETQTAPSYLDRLTEYMNKTETASECRELAADHIKSTLSSTAIKFQLSYEGLNTLGSVESAQKHIKALETSFSEITSKFGTELTESDSMAINKGLSVLDKNIEIDQQYNSPTLRF